MSGIIEISNLSVEIDDNLILDKLNLSLAQGGITGLLGPSGAGKTTLIKALLGLTKPTKGRVDILGLPAGSKSLKSSIGYVAQSKSVYSDLTVEENLQYFGSLVGASKQQIRVILNDVELNHESKRLVAKLSGGQQSKVSLAIALLGEPKILLLDEPTVGLDPVLRRKLWQKFRKLADSGVTIVVSSHVMDEADMCDDLIFLYEGRLLVHDSRQAVLKQTNTANTSSAFVALASEGQA